MDISECIIIVKDIVISLAACITAYVAYTGLNKWQKELKGKVYFDAAKDLIRAVYKFRDEMSYTRNGFIMPNEHPDGYDHFNRDTKKKAEAYAYIYNNRMKPLISSAQDFDVYTLEAEALWGSEIKTKCLRLRKTFFRLQRSIQSNIDDIGSGYENLKDELELRKEIKSDISESIKKDDSLSNEIETAIKEIESIIRPYLDKNL